MRRRTDEERTAYVQGYAAAIRAVQQRGLKFALVSLGLMKAVEDQSSNGTDPLSQWEDDGGR